MRAGRSVVWSPPTVTARNAAGPRTADRSELPPMPTDIDLDRVADLIRAAADAEIMPRFRKLEAHQIRAKTAGELVTEADVATERVLGRALAGLLAGSTVVGEEGYEADPGVLLHLDRDGPVWIVDPVDGTQNFADGHACFAVIVALSLARRVVAGWIYDPVNGNLCMARAGEGAWWNGARLPAARRPADPKRPLEGLRGSVAKRFSENLRDQPNGPACVARYRCVGREYMDLAAGRLDFVQYGRRLKPWDHAAGILIARETGRHAALIATGEPYDATRGIVEGDVLVAPDAATWQALRPLLVR